MSDIQLNEQDSSDSTSQNPVESPQQPTGTKIGKVSEFEKD